MGFYRPRRFMCTLDLACGKRTACYPTGDRDPTIFQPHSGPKFSAAVRWFWVLGLDCAVDLGMACHVHQGLYGWLFLQASRSLRDSIIKLVAWSWFHLTVYVDSFGHQRCSSCDHGCHCISVVLPSKCRPCHTIARDCFGCS